MLVLVLSILLIAAHGRIAAIDEVRRVLSTLLSPFQFLVHWPFELADWFDEGITSRHQLQAENAELRDRVLILESQLQRMLDLETENVQLRNLLGAVKRGDERRLIAEVMHVDSNPYRHLVTLNKGRQSGIYDGQAVLDAKGIIGQVLHVGELTCEVILITDPSHAIPVRVSRNGVRAIAVGTGDLNRLRLKHVPETADIQVGDVLISSGLGGRFPEGYPVAEVRSIEQKPGEAFSEVTVVPVANLDRIRQVLLLWPLPPEGLMLEERP